ncbi:Hypothetical predicted protein, partial [Olea europaea subsp. europaea]
ASPSNDRMQSCTYSSELQITALHVQRRNYSALSHHSMTSSDGGTSSPGGIVK